MPSAPDHGVYSFVIDGEVRINDTVPGRRDSTGLWGVQPLRLRTGRDSADLLFVQTAP